VQESFMPGTSSSKAATAAHPPAHAPAKTAAPAPTATMFGVAIATTPAHSTAEKPEMSQKKKRLILAGGLLVATALVLYLQYRPTSDLDPEAAANPGVRQVVELEKKKDTAGLTGLITSTDSAVARRAVTSLAGVGQYDAIQAALKDRRPEVRYAAVSGLGLSGDVSQLPTLAQYAQDPEPDVRIAAMRGIANIRDFSIFDHLIPMLSDPQMSVRKAALMAIEDRVGLKFPDFKPDGTAAERGAAIGRIRAMLPKMKQVFDRANEFELKRLQQQK
jgi:HEAT repeat protein